MVGRNEEQKNKKSLRKESVQSQKEKLPSDFRRDEKILVKIPDETQ